MKNRYVRWGDQLVPRFIFDWDFYGTPPDSCPECGGIGFVAVDVDEERYREAWPCQTCKTRCKKCGVYYLKNTVHECKEKAR